MSSAIADVTYGVVPGFPAGTAQPLNCTVSAVATNAANTPQPQTVPIGTASVLFATLNPDTYTFTAQAVDQNGTPIPGATPATTTYSVSAPTTVSLNLPTAISVVAH